MVVNSLFPVFALIAAGCLLKRYGLTNDGFLKTSDRLIYFIFFPAMLFWKIGSKPSGAQIDWHFCAAVFCALTSVYLLSGVCIRIFNIPDFQVGTFSQSCYRFNSYIGMAIVLNALGGTGIAQFGILIGFIIPVINVMAVSTLIWYSGKRFTFRERLGLTLKALVSNPLILACVAGVIYARFIHTFPVFLDNTFRLLSLATLPLALLSIGGALTFDSLKGYFKASMVAAAIKLLVFPAAGYAFLTAFEIGGVAFRTGMIFFALPASTAIYVLSSQLNSDTDLASASIVLSTVLSFVSLSATLFLFF